MDKGKLGEKEKTFLKKIRIGETEFYVNNYLNTIIILIIISLIGVMIYEYNKIPHKYYITCKYDICYNDLYDSEWCQKNSQEPICEKQFIYKGEVYGSKIGKNYYIALYSIWILIILIPLLNYILYNRGVKLE